MFKGGEHIETQGPWTVEKQRVVFTDLRGVLPSIRLDLVDLEASENAEKESGTGRSPPEAIDEGEELGQEEDSAPPLATLARTPSDVPAAKMVIDQDDVEPVDVVAFLYRFRLLPSHFPSPPLSVQHAFGREIGWIQSELQAIFLEVNYRIHAGEAIARLDRLAAAIETRASSHEHRTRYLLKDLADKLRLPGRLAGPERYDMVLESMENLERLVDANGRPGTETREPRR